MRKIANALQVFSVLALLFIGMIDVNDLTIWHVVVAVILLVPLYIGKVIERCLED